MPYIKAEERTDEHLKFPENAGQLNWSLTRNIQAYIARQTHERSLPAPNYALYNEVMGVLACMQQELYRRVIAPYEDQKANENGDVF